MDNYVAALAEFIPGDYPPKALNNLTIEVCLKQADSIPRGLQGILCIYRSLYSLIDYNLLDRDLHELKRNAIEEEFNETISDYTGLFAEAFCKPMKDDFASQIKAVDAFLADDDADFKKWCTTALSEQFNLFSPQINSLNSETFFFENDELCDIFGMAYKELKEEYDDDTNKKDLEADDLIKVDGLQKDTLRTNFIKLMNVVPFELFMEKQRTNYRQNCFNSVMLDTIKDAETYCTMTLPTRINFTLWTNRNQLEVCNNALRAV